MKHAYCTIAQLVRLPSGLWCSGVQILLHTLFLVFLWERERNSLHICRICRVYLKSLPEIAAYAKDMHKPVVYITGVLEWVEYYPTHTQITPPGHVSCGSQDSQGVFVLGISIHTGHSDGCWFSQFHPNLGWDLTAWQRVPSRRLLPSISKSLILSTQHLRWRGTTCDSSYIGTQTLVSPLDLHNCEASKFMPGCFCTRACFLPAIDALLIYSSILTCSTGLYSLKMSTVLIGWVLGLFECHSGVPMMVGTLLNSKHLVPKIHSALAEWISMGFCYVLRGAAK